MQNHLHQPLLSVSGSRLFTHLRLGRVPYSVFISLLLSWLVFGISGTAYADTPTPTPDPGWQPLFPTNTPAPTNDYTCPEGNPGGWGDVTPDPYWALQCGQCAGGTTPTPEGTPEPTPDGTPTPEPDGYFLVLYPEADPHFQEHAGSYAANFYYNWDSFIIDCGEGNTFEGGIAYGETSRDYAAPFGKIPTYNGGLWAMAYGCGNDLLGSSKVSGVNCYDAVSPLISQAGLPEPITWTAREDHVNAAINAQTNFHIFDPGDTYWPKNTYIEVGFHVAAAICYGTPPEPQSDATYCKDVLPEGGSGEDPGMSLPTILIGGSSCTQILGWDLDLSVLNLVPGVDDVGTVSMPGFNLCVAPIQFGSVELFDISVDLDAIAFLAAGVAIIRILWRS